MSTVLALICTDFEKEKRTLNGRTLFIKTGPRHLPQGSCTSPALSNLCFLPVDSALASLAKRSGYRYSRYADDLFFSPRSDGERKSLRKILFDVRRALTLSGFSENQKKARVMRAGTSQRILGVTANVKVNLPRNQVRHLRASLDWAERFGIRDIVFLHLRGRWGYLRMINRDVAERLANRHPWIREATDLQSTKCTRRDLSFVRIWKNSRLGLVLAIDSYFSGAAQERDKPYGTWAWWSPSRREFLKLVPEIFVAKSKEINDPVLLGLVYEAFLSWAQSSQQRREKVGPEPEGSEVNPLVQTLFNQDVSDQGISRKSLAAALALMGEKQKLEFMKLVQEGVPVVKAVDEVGGDGACVLLELRDPQSPES